MAVSFVGVTTASSPNTTVTLSTHANTQVGDIIIALCVRDEGYATASWTGNPFTLLRTLDAGTSTSTGGRIQIWARQATVAGATSYSYVDSGNNSTGLVHLVVVRGAVMPTATNTAAQSNATSTTPASPAVGSGTLDMLITAFGTRANGAARTFGVGASGLTSLGQVTDSSGYYSSFAAYGLGVAAGAKSHSLSPTTTTRAAAIYLVASAAASQDVTVSGIASGEAFGSASVTAGAVSASPAGIPSAEAFGSPALVAGAVPVTATGIPSAEAFGTSALALTVSPTGIPSGEAVGTPNVQQGNVIAADGIPSGEVVPSPVLAAGPVSVTASGIPSGEAVPSPAVVLTVSPAGIGSAEAFGSPALVAGAVSVTLTGIPSAEVVPAPVLAAGPVSLGPTGIPSAEAVGVPRLSLTVVLAGIPSAEAFGTGTLTSGPVSILLAGIPSAEAFGQLEVTVTIDPNRRGGRPVDRTTVRYELVMVARIPASTGPPALVEVDSVRWRSLNWSSTLSKPQALTAQVKEATLPEAVAQRLRGPDRLATEFKLLRDGQTVFAGPLRTWRKQGEIVTIDADGLASYLQGMIVTSDLRYDQVDQHLIVKDLVDRWQSYFAYTHAGIDTSAITPSGRLRDGSYAYREIHVLSRRIEELGAREDGFDYDIDPTTRQLQLWYPQKGIDRSSGADAVIFDDHNVDSLDVMCSVSSDDVATYAFGAGSSSATDGTLWSAYYSEEAAAAYGGFALTQSWSDVSEQSTLNDHTLALLRAHKSALFVPGPKARVTADADLTSYDVGDTVGFESSGLLAVRGAYRIRKRSVQVQEDGTEAVDLEFV